MGIIGINKCVNRIPKFYPETEMTAELVNIRNIHPHYHYDTLEFIYCLKGIVYANVAHEYCTINEGELVTVDHSDIRNILASDDNITLLVHMGLKDTHVPIELVENTCFSCATLLSGDKMEFLNKICDNLMALMYAKCMYDQKKKDEKWFTNTCESIRINTIDLLVKKFSWFSIHSDPEEDILYKERLSQIIAYVSQHSHERITLSQMADVLYLSPAYISNFLRHTTFESFTRLVNYYRCLIAQRMLIETDHSVGDISEVSGFSSEKYFYKHFKYYFGTTPIKYRKQFNEYLNKREEYLELDPQDALEIIKSCIAERHIIRAAENKAPK